MGRYAPILLTACLISSCGPDAVRPTVEDPADPPEIPLVLTLPRNSGDGQVARVASYVAEPLVVRVMQGNTPVAGVPIRWVSANPTGRVEPLSDVSDQNGYASARFFTATTAGDQGVIAVLGLQWLGVRVRATPAAPARLQPITLVNDTTPILTGIFLRVKVEDEYGNGVPGIYPSWSTPRQDNVGLNNDGRPTDVDGVAFTNMIFVAGPQTAVVTVSVPDFPGIAPIQFVRSAY